VNSVAQVLETSYFIRHSSSEKKIFNMKRKLLMKV